VAIILPSLHDKKLRLHLSVTNIAHLNWSRVFGNRLVLGSRTWLNTLKLKFRVGTKEGVEHKLRYAAEKSPKHDTETFRPFASHAAGISKGKYIHSTCACALAFHIYSTLRFGQRAGARADRDQVFSQQKAAQFACFHSTFHRTGSTSSLRVTNRASAKAAQHHKSSVDDQPDSPNWGVVEGLAGLGIGQLASWNFVNQYYPQKREEKW
jgi:hypothetical protein